RDTPQGRICAWLERHARPADIGVLTHLPGATAYDDRRRPVAEAGASQVADRAINPEAATVEIVVLEECQLSGGRNGRDESEAYNTYGALHRVSFHHRSIGTLCHPLRVHYTRAGGICFVVLLSSDERQILCQTDVRGIEAVGRWAAWEGA